MNRQTALWVTLVALGLGAFLLFAARGPSDWYRGYFSHDQQIERLVRRLDPSVTHEGTGGGGGGGTGTPRVSGRTHLLKGKEPIGPEYLGALRKVLLEEMKREEIKVIAEKDAGGSDSNYPAAGVRFRTWGFQILFDDHGYKGVVTIRLTSKQVPGTDSLGHPAELYENIVVFLRD